MPSEPLHFGDIVLIRFPSTNQTGSKQRPAVVVSNTTYTLTRPDVIIMAVTSQLRESAGLGEVWLADWRAAGLLKPSAIKPVFATVEQSLILRCLGVLQPPDQASLRDAIASILG